MKEIIFLILGLIVGSNATIVLMCCLQINRIKELEEENNVNEDNKSDTEVLPCEVEK